MDQLHPISTILPAMIAMMVYGSFETFVRGFLEMNSENPETQKVHLVVAPTGSGKTTEFIAKMVAKYPKILIVLCLPRRLACNVAVYLRSHYKLKVAVRNGEIHEDLGEDTSVLITTYQSAINAVVSAIIHIFRKGRQVSFVFDECHETCPEAVRLYKLFNSLFAKKPVWLHSLFCVSATMDPVELSTRLKIEQQFIQTSMIEAPPKTFERGQRNVKPINVVDIDKEEAKDKKPQKPDEKEKKDEEEKKPELKQEDHHIQQFMKNYLHKFVKEVLEFLKEL